MQMKIMFFLPLFFFSAGFLLGQDKDITRIPPTEAIQDYLSQTKEYTALYNGKIVTPYDKVYTNHAYLVTDKYVSGTLCYNDVVYSDVNMRLDLFRDELSIMPPDKPFPVVLESRKLNYALLSGVTVIANPTNTGQQYGILIDDGICPVVKQFRVTVKEEYAGIELRWTFRFQEQYFVYINGIASPVKNKNALLKLFPDKRKELNDFAKQHKLNFRAQIEQSIVALINHYENPAQ